MADDTEASSSVQPPGGGGRRPRHWPVLVLLFVLLMVSLGMGGAMYGRYRFDRPGPTTADLTVVIPRGVGAVRISEQLAQRGLIAGSLDRHLFQVGIKLTGLSGRLRAGEYAFPAGISLRGIAELLASGRAVIRKVTFAEGLTSAEMITILRQTDGLEGEVTAVPAEGSLLPETYHYSYGDARADVVDRMHRAMSETVAALWAARGPQAPTDRHAAVTLASIVEKETGVGTERARIAAVFLNRLRVGMKLQSDPTVIYGIDATDGQIDHALTRADLQRPSPYNTYVIDGLPPGPICNPGRAALEAVLSPTESEDLYFVADGSGGHAFARTLDDHNRNVARWRKIERDRKTPN